MFDEALVKDGAGGNVEAESTFASARRHGFTHVNWGLELPVPIYSGDPFVRREVASVVNRVDARALESVTGRQGLHSLTEQGLRDPDPKIVFV